MRAEATRRRGAVGRILTLMVVAGSLASCGGDDPDTAATTTATTTTTTTTTSTTTSTTTAADTTTTTTATTTTTSSATTTTTSGTTTTTAIATTSVVAFTPSGLGVVALGEPPRRVVAVVEDAVGFAPTDDTGWMPSSDVAPICPGPHVRIVEFGGLHLLFADGGSFAAEGTPQFVAYWYVAEPPALGSATSGGLALGMTVADLTTAMPAAELSAESGRFGPTFTVDGSGPGELLWGEITGVESDDVVVSIRGGIGCGD